MRFVRVPVASHGLHKNNVNQPILTTARFFDIIPARVKDYRAGERIKIQGSMFSRLNPTSVASMVTGRFSFRHYFVPYRFLWAPYDNFDTGTQYTSIYPSSLMNNTYIDIAPSFTNLQLSRVFATNVGASTLNLLSVATAGSYDVELPSFGLSTGDYYNFTEDGAALLKVLNGLGYQPTWSANDTTPRNSFSIRAYLKVYLDYFWPKQFINNAEYQFINSTITNEDNNENITSLCQCIIYCLKIKYDDSIFDCAWTNPVSPSDFGNNSLTYRIPDITNQGVGTGSQGHIRQTVTNSPSAGVDDNPSNAGAFPNNGTPYVTSEATNTSNPDQYRVRGVITQYVIDALQSLNNFVKRHQIAGGKLLDNFLVSRGFAPSNEVLKKSYFIGQKDYEISIDAVENNSENVSTSGQSYLGELAGKGVAGSGNDDLIKVDTRFDADGVFITLCLVIPDAALSCLNEPSTFAYKQLDFYHAEFDKLGTAPIPQLCVFTSPQSGPLNDILKDKVFGFLNRYYWRLQNNPKLFGDFNIVSRGAHNLEAYHTFRVIRPQDIGSNQGLYMSPDWLSGKDSNQYQRIFYSDKPDNMMLFVRWFGEEYLEKLPLGDSIDWDDDEYNKKVEIVQNSNIM